MGAFGLLLRIVVPVVSAGTLGWLVAGGVMALLVRWAERGRVLSAGPPGAAALQLGGYAVGAAVFASGCAGVTLYVLVLVASATGLPADQPLVRLWHFLIWLAAALAIAAAVIAAARGAVQAMGATRRRWELLGLDVPQRLVPPIGAPVLPAVGEPGGRSIVILCDGTSNRPDETEDGAAAPTNIHKLYKALAADEAQTVWYEAGVGSDTSSTAKQAWRTQQFLSFFGANTASQVAANWRRLVKIIEGAFGTGISETIVNGYTEIVRQYRPGDRIYLVGFSRGAYAARCIAAVIARCGLLRAGNIRYAPEMVQIYRSRPRQDGDAPVRPELLHGDPAVEFVGVFDTVASLGVPLWGWWFRFSPVWDNQPLMTDPVRVCRHVYHALAMDEQRSEFFPTLYTWPKVVRAGDKLKTLDQVWFRGAHADIGGGYARTELSDITLGWMMDAMTRHGLRFKAAARLGWEANSFGLLHSELERRPFWQLLGSWPRWHPTPGDAPDPAGTVLHPSVLARAAYCEGVAGRFDMHRLPVGKPVVFTAQANRAWCRPGIVIETGALYRLRWVGDQWRDASAAPCGPEGQEATGIWDFRRWWTSGRRMPGVPWMQLVMTVAHPREWKLLERPLRDLIKMLVGNDPEELKSQLAAIGRDLLRPEGVVFRSDAPAGLLHLFANDWWQTASNNSGGLRLEIERIADGRALWVLGAEGAWSRA